MIRPFFHSSQHGPEANRQVGEFVSTLIWGRPDRFGPHCSLAVVDDKTLIAGIVYHNCDEDAGIIELSGASVSKKWARPHVLSTIYNIAFDLLGMQMILQRVKAGNAVHLTQLRRLGLQEAVIARGAGRDEDLHMFTMTDDQWRDHPLRIRDIDRKAKAI